MNEAIPIGDYLKSLDKDGGFRETKDILESIPHDAKILFGKNPFPNAYVCLRTSHYINGVPELEIWINGAVLTVEANHVSGDIAPHFQG